MSLMGKQYDQELTAIEIWLFQSNFRYTENEGHSSQSKSHVLLTQFFVVPLLPLLAAASDAQWSLARHVTSSVT